MRDELCSDSVNMARPLQIPATDSSLEVEFILVAGKSR